MARRRSSAAAKKRHRQPARTAAELAALPERQRAARSRALRALSRTRREGISLSRAAEAEGTRASTVRRHAGTALVRDGRRWTPRQRDRLLRQVRFVIADPFPDVVVLETKDSRTASKIGAYWVAVGEWLETGDTEGLDEFRRQTITVQRKTIPFVTDLEVLRDLADAGQLSMDEIYAGLTRAR